MGRRLGPTLWADASTEVCNSGKKCHYSPFFGRIMANSDILCLYFRGTPTKLPFFPSPPENSTLLCRYLSAGWPAPRNKGIICRYFSAPATYRSRAAGNGNGDGRGSATGRGTPPGTLAGISHRPGRSARGAGGDQPWAGPLCTGRQCGPAMGWATLHGTLAGVSHGPRRSARGAGGDQQ